MYPTYTDTATLLSVLCSFDTLPSATTVAAAAAQPAAATQPAATATKPTAAHGAFSSSPYTTTHLAKFLYPKKSLRP
jgi:hypothetical protein